MTGSLVGVPLMASSCWVGSRIGPSSRRDLSACVSVRAILLADWMGFFFIAGKLRNGRHLIPSQSIVIGLRRRSCWPQFLGKTELGVSVGVPIVDLARDLVAEVP